MLSRVWVSLEAILADVCGAAVGATDAPLEGGAQLVEQARELAAREQELRYQEGDAACHKEQAQLWESDLATRKEVKASHEQELDSHDGSLLDREAAVRERAVQLSDQEKELICELDQQAAKVVAISQ
ncbi:hypothetical protein SEVIR_9G310032v4 [Setaria viridis]